ncbi:MAG: DEAD/DEAH box helicase, partial [Spirochaetes bacterium]|nr:DEAD/DEAH box helicase [Spirochaetota bacterium]
MAVFFDLVFDIPADQSFSYRMDEKGEAAVGKRAMVPFGRSSKDQLGFITSCQDRPPEGLDEKSIKTIRRVVDKEPVFDIENIELARWMAAYYLCGTGQALSAMIPSGKRVTSYPALAGDTGDFAEKRAVLSTEQQKALDEILSPRGKPSGKLHDKLPEMFYLFGITGSGKTEVFLRAAERMLEEGKSAIYLVPEISLTHQAAELISKRFGTQAATLHSAMSPAARLAEWMRIRSGDVRIVAGPRSAVFAPVKDLGLIIIDEEHDGSYKSGNTPRYHARQAAVHRCQVAGAKLVMGSATPSAEAWKLMADGVIKRLNLSRRLGG